jgi:hypothetical protein
MPNTISVLALQKATNLVGGLNPNLKARIIALVENPTQETWDNAHSIIVNGDRCITLWKAVLRVDPTFPRSRIKDQPWERIPDRDTVLEAITQATS